MDVDTRKFFVGLGVFLLLFVVALGVLVPSPAEQCHDACYPHSVRSWKPNDCQCNDQ